MGEDTIFELVEHWNLHKEDLNEQKFYLFNVRDGDIIKLNETSFEILKAIDGSKSVRDIFSQVAELYDVDDSVLWEDVKKLLGQCVERGIIAQCG